MSKYRETVENDIWASEAVEAESDPDYIQLKNEAINNFNTMAIQWQYN